MKKNRNLLIAALLSASFSSHARVSYDYENIGSQFRSQLEQVILSKNQLLSSVTNKSNSLKHNGLLDEAESMISSINKLETLLIPLINHNNYSLGMMVIESLTTNNSCLKDNNTKYLTFDSIVYKCEESAILREFNLGQDYQDLIIKTITPLKGVEFYSSYQSGELEKIRTRISALMSEIYSLPTPTLIKKTTFSCKNHPCQWRF